MMRKTLNEVLWCIFVYNELDFVVLLVLYLFLSNLFFSNGVLRANFRCERFINTLLHL